MQVVIVYGLMAVCALFIMATVWMERKRDAKNRTTE